MSVSLILLEILNPKEVLGEATIEGFTGQISIESFSWGVEAETVEKKGALPLTTVKPKSLSLTKQFDRSSTVLCQMMDNDKPFTAKLRFIDPTTMTNGQAKFDSILEISMIDCHIEEISLNADDSGKSVSVSEKLTLSFEKSITLHYRSYDATTRSRTKAMTALIKTPDEK